jgi:hypothetical protein
MWAARHAHYGTEEIGRRLGRRDHTTIIYGSERAAERAETDAAYARMLRELAGLPEVEEAPAAAPITTLPRGSRWWLHQAYGSRARLTLAA